MPASPPQHIVLNVLVFREGNQWVAQALQHDLAAQGPTIERARRAFVEALAAQCRLDQEQHRPPLEHLAPAPQEYWDAWDEATAKFLVNPSAERDVEMPPACVIQAITDATPELHR